MPSTDIFLCYRRAGAQTAKLFKRYLESHHFPGSIWYSDCEALGNYKNDIPELVASAECAILFIDPNFTAQFNDPLPKRLISCIQQMIQMPAHDTSDSAVTECITSVEVTHIASKMYHDKNFRLITVYLDRNEGFCEKEIKDLKQLFVRSGLEDPDTAVKSLSQNNMMFFSTARDDEDSLFDALVDKMLPNKHFSRPELKYGNFYFGCIPTTVDVVSWDNHGIRPKDIIFEHDLTSIPVVDALYNRIKHDRTRIEYELQNNTMLSFVGFETCVADDTEEKSLNIRYRKIEYKLFYKTLKLWESFGLDKVIARYDWRKDAYPIPNAMGLAFTVITADNKLIFTKRSVARKVRPDEYDCSIVEGLKPYSLNEDNSEYDTGDPDYLEKEISRAFCEEICRADNLDMKVYGLVLDKKYGQWNIIGAIRTSHTSRDILHLHSVRDDTFEINSMEFVDVMVGGQLDITAAKASLEKYLRKGIWGMALVAVYAALLDLGAREEDIKMLSKAIATRYEFPETARPEGGRNTAR